MNELALIFELFSSGSQSTFPFPAPLFLPFSLWHYAICVSASRIRSWSLSISKTTLLRRFEACLRALNLIGSIVLRAWKSALAEGVQISRFPAII